MGSVLLSIHILASILFVGGSAVAASLFPRYVPVSVAAGGPVDGSGAEHAGDRSRATAVALHRVTKGYGALAVIVPAVGIVLGLVQGRMGELWIILSMVLALAAGLLLALLICPRQRAALGAPDDSSRLRGLSMITGIYNVLWTVILVLMVVQPE